MSPPQGLCTCLEVPHRAGPVDVSSQTSPPQRGCPCHSGTIASRCQFLEHHPFHCQIFSYRFSSISTNLHRCSMRKECVRWSVGSAWRMVGVSGGFWKEARRERRSSEITCQHLAWLACGAWPGDRVSGCRGASASGRTHRRHWEPGCLQPRPPGGPRATLCGCEQGAGEPGLDGAPGTRHSPGCAAAVASSLRAALPRGFRRSAFCRGQGGRGRGGGSRAFAGPPGAPGGAPPRSMNCPPRSHSPPPPQRPYSSRSICQLSSPSSSRSSPSPGGRCQPAFTWPEPAGGGDGAARGA